MRARCYNPKNKDFHSYGGRGIAVCDQWRDSFESFLSDMGQPPEGLTLDRIDVDGDYEPSNCRWADLFTQAANSRSAITVQFDGEQMCVSEACRRLGRRPCVVSTLRDRMKWTTQEAIDHLARPEIRAKGYRVPLLPVKRPGRRLGAGDAGVHKGTL